MRTVDVAGLPWVEIDFPVDLARARNEVWPEIRGKTYRKRRRRQIAALAILAGLVIGTAAALPYLTRPDPPPPTEWVTLVFDELYEERVAIGGQLQNWWMLEADQMAEVVVTGPGKVRLETRLIDRPREREAYVLEVLIDGEANDWHKLVTRPSGRATHPTLTISHKKRVTIEIPEGRHSLGVRLVAPRDTDCLVRVRQPDVDTEETIPE